jgi:hypothetical protein
MKYSGISNVDTLVRKAGDVNTQIKILEYFKNNPTPEDESGVHKMSEDLGIDTHKFEESIYAILGGFLGNGRSKDFKGEYDPEQLKMGIEVEKEHLVGCSLPAEIIDKIAEKIAMDHLAEYKFYYTALKKMEDGFDSAASSEDSKK